MSGDLIDKHVTGEAEPMIRCKDCKHYCKDYTDSYGDLEFVWGDFCDKWKNVTVPTGYCFKAEERGKNMTESQKMLVRELVEKGLSDAEISEKMFYSESYIRRVRIDVGIRRKRGAPIPKSKVSRVKKLHDEGFSKKRIAKLLGISPTTVRKYLGLAVVA